MGLKQPADILFGPMWPPDNFEFEIPGLNNGSMSRPRANCKGDTAVSVSIHFLIKKYF